MPNSNPSVDFTPQIVVTGGEILVNTVTYSDQTTPQITVLANGGFVVAWVDFSYTAPNTSGPAVRAQVFTAAGAMVGTEILVNTTTAGPQNNPRIIALSNGGFVITWEDASGAAPDASGYAVKAQVFTAAGAMVGTEILVNSAVESDQAAPQITALSNGDFVVTWRDLSQGVLGATGDTSGYAVKAQVFTAAGVMVGTEIRVNTAVDGSQYDARITALEGGGFVVTWNDQSQGVLGATGDTSSFAVKAQVFTAAGAMVGTEILVNTAVENAQFGPQITALPSGGFVVTWSDYSQGVLGATGDTSGYAVKAQIFNVGPSAVEQVALNLKAAGFTVSDPDAGDVLTVTLSTTYGLLTVTAGTSGAIVSGSGTASVTLTGTAAEIAALLSTDGTSTVSFYADTDTPPASATITLAADDGAGGTASTSLIVPIEDTSGISTTPSGGADVLTGTGGGDTILALDGADTVDGGAGNDLLDGGAGDDVLIGGLGNDRLRGGTGADAMSGGTGDDVYVVDNAGDTTDETGGDGTDTVASTISWTLTDGTENLTLAGSAGLSGTGNGADNVITGNSGANILSGLGGADTINADGGNDTVNGGDGADTLNGQVGDDTLNGDAGIDTLNGGNGNDTLNGGTGADAMTGGLGNDIFYVDDAGDSVVENAAEGTDEVRAAITYTLGGNVETLTLTGGGDINGTGNALRNIITGNTGANVILAGAEVDTVSGGDGADSLYGEAGNDTLNGDDGADLLDGGDGDDTLNGGAGADYLRGGVGADRMTGGAGDDYYVIDNVGDTTDETGGDGTDSVISRITWTLRDGTENLTLAAPGGTINGTGNAADNTILGNSSANILRGLGGADSLNGDGGNDTLYGGDGADTLDGSVGADTLYGDAGIDSLIGGAGADILDGGTGADSMAGGLGNDTYYVDDTLDTITEGVGEGTDAVESSVSYTLAANVENLTLLLLAGNVDGTGSNVRNTIIGTRGDNVLHGMGDTDTLYGGNGADTLYGDDGNDVLYGENDNDTLYGGNGEDTLTGGGGADTFVFTDLDIHRTGLGQAANKDKILDLSFNANDRIDLSAIDANTGLGGDQAFTFVSKFTGVAGQATLTFSGGVTALSLDVDGDGYADLRVEITGNVTATTTNLYTGGGDTNGGWVL